VTPQTGAIARIPRLVLVLVLALGFAAMHTMTTTVVGVPAATTGASSPVAAAPAATEVQVLPIVAPVPVPGPTAPSDATIADCVPFAATALALLIALVLTSASFLPSRRLHRAPTRLLTARRLVRGRAMPRVTLCVIRT